MNRLLVAGLVIMLTCTAHAGGNPDIRIYIDFDPPNYVHEIAPEPYTSFDAYVCLDQVDEGVTCVALGLTDLREEHASVIGADSWTALFPGDLAINWPWCAMNPCSTECMTDDEGPVLIGYATYFYLGGSACLEILNHIDYPRWVVDCSTPAEVDYYCVLAHGSINGGECPDGDCSPVPVQSETWGTIKSLYR